MVQVRVVIFLLNFDFSLKTQSQKVSKVFEGIMRIIHFCIKLLPQF